MNVSKSYGDKVLFDKISFHINKGEKVAIVGQNGTGKSSLLEILAGVDQSDGDQAKIEIHKDIILGYLNQEPVFNAGNTVIEEILSIDHPMVEVVKGYRNAIDSGNENAQQEWLLRMDDLKAWSFEAKINQTLDRLNLKDQSMSVSLLSGGQQKRLALAKLLIREPDFIILDEPTNHLDIDMIEWIEEYLARPSVTLLMVTHDRYFLNQVCNVILEIEGGILFKHRGNYEHFLESKATRESLGNIQHDKNKKLLGKELAWIRRQPKARGTKAKSRISKFDVLEDEVAGKTSGQSLNLQLKTRRLGSKILEAYGVTKSFDTIKIIENYFYKFKKGEKIGIVGANGVGKSTFIELLMGDLRPDSGKIVKGETITFGYYAQSGMVFPEAHSIIDVIRDIAEYIPLENGSRLTAEQLLERFLFPRSQQRVKVSKLSGGERRRLYLLTVLITNPNFLILDEPTNDLDILTLNVLEDYLMEFNGCVLIVSHDRYMLDKVAEHLFVFKGQGEIKDYNGTYSEYRASLKK